MRARRKKSGTPGCVSTRRAQGVSAGWAGTATSELDSRGSRAEIR